MKPWLKRTLIGGAVATALVATIGAVSAHRHHGGWPRTDAEITQMKGRFVDRAAEHLALDAAQKQRLAVVADRLQEQHKLLRGSGADPKTELRSLVAGPAFDRAKALQLVQDKTVAVQAKGPEVVNAFADFYDGLNPDQQQKLRDMMDRRHAR